MSLSRFREETYGTALRKNGSQMVSLFDQIEVGKNLVKKPWKKR